MQSNFIAACVLVAFIIFITLRGELQSYLAIFKGQTFTTSPESSGGSGSSAGGAGSLFSGTAADVLQGGGSIGSILDTSGLDSFSTGVSGAGSTGGFFNPGITSNSAAQEFFNAVPMSF